MKNIILLIIVVSLSYYANSQSLLESNSIKIKSPQKESSPDTSYKSNLRHAYTDFLTEADLSHPVSIATPPASPPVLPKGKKLSSYNKDPVIKDMIDKYVASQKEYFESIRTVRIDACDDLIKYTDSLIKNQAALYYKNNNLVIILDTTTSIESKEKIYNEISQLSGEMYILKRNLDNYYRNISDLIADVQRFNYDSYFTPIDSIPHANEKIKKNWKNFDEQITVLKNKIINSDTVILKTITQKWNKIVGDILPSAKKNADAKSKESDFGALPGLSSIIGQREVNFNISVLGYQKIKNDNSSVYGEIKLFTGVVKTDSVQNLRTLFIPEASTFGVTGKMTIGLGVIGKNSENEKFGINLELNLLSKKLKPDNSHNDNSFNPLVFHTKTGLEYIAVKNIVSFYANVNTLTILDHVTDYKEALNTTKLFLGFVDFGAKMLLAPTDNGIGKLGLKLKIDLGCIANGGDVKAIIKSNDLVIPTFKFGVQKDL